MTTIFRVTPEEVRKVIEWQSKIIEHVDACLKNKKSRRPDQVPEFLSKANEGELIALAVGANQIVENILLNLNCYNGYDTLGELRTIKVSEKTSRVVRPFAGKRHPEYADWRRRYHTRDIVMDGH